MDIQTITMPAHEAREHLRQYRRQLHRRADAEYEAAAKGYEKLAEGKVLLDVGSAIRSAPVDEKGRPKLAIARSDRRQVRYQQEHSLTAVFDSSDERATHGRASLRVEVRMLQLPPPNASGYRHVEGYALVPMVPAGVRTEVRNRQLRTCFTLWEVEAWADRSFRAMPDPDPYLLEHVGGDLYAVLASWDLTPLERAIMAGRAAR